MDSSEEVHSISEEFSSPLELKKGMSIFIDVSTSVFSLLITFLISNGDGVMGVILIELK